jgi:hypothetical protein
MNDYTAPTLNWEITKEENVLIQSIVERAFTHDQISNHLDPMTLQMDITATHCNGTKLDLERFLKSDDFNFIHDIVGIINHINRYTGKLSNCFLPRFAKEQ